MLRFVLWISDALITIYVRLILDYIFFFFSFRECSEILYHNSVAKIVAGEEWDWRNTNEESFISLHCVIVYAL